jgi:SprT protein
MVFSIPKLIQYACDTNNVSELAETIEFKFNKRFTKRLGDANANTRTIRFSTLLWERASEEQRKETVIHETCHIVAYYKAWMQKQHILDSHGKEWVTAMKNAGYDSPNKYHKVNRAGLKKKYSAYYVACNCATRKVTSYMFTLIIDKQWHCDRCGETYRQAYNQ